MTHHHHSLLLTTLLAGCALGDSLPVDETDDAELARGAPSPGAPGVGDVLYPTLGNGGYDVAHYHLALRYATAEPTQQLSGTVTILARATQALSRFDLDFHGDGFGTVTVDGRRAEAQWDGDELVIVPPRAIQRGDLFVVRVADFTATPIVPDPTQFLGAPFFATPDGSAWAGQSAFAHHIFPSNDHPSDKASFTFSIDVPAGTTAVANGVLVGQHTAGDRTLWLYDQEQPMATELAQVAVGAFTVLERGSHDGVIVRDVVPTRLAADLEPKLAAVTDHLDFMAGLVGAYPFDSYGTLVVDTQLGFALETQTLSLFEGSFFALDPAQFEPIMVHELAHQWFGDSVAPAVWSDVWLNEGHASWYEYTFQLDPDSDVFLEQARQVYALGDQFRAAFGPVGAPRSGNPVDLFNPNVYVGGALTLFALRQVVGDATFKDIERAWVHVYRGRSASTADFIALASRVAGQDLTDFLNDWIYGTTTPAMPGHPDWTVDPVTASFQATVPSAWLSRFRHRLLSQATSNSDVKSPAVSKT